MRISDWSSDVCSSDLNPFLARLHQPPQGPCAAWRESVSHCRHASSSPRPREPGRLVAPAPPVPWADRARLRVLSSLRRSASLAHFPAGREPTYQYRRPRQPPLPAEIGRAHVCTQVTHAQIVCLLLLVTKKN